MGDLTDDELNGLDATSQWMVNARGAGLTETDQHAVGAKIGRVVTELQRRRAAQTASAEGMWTVVREDAAAVLERAGISEPHRSCDAESIADRVADRVASQLTAPPPGHVCPVPYGLGPEDLDALEELAGNAETMVDWPRAREALHKVLAEHRAPTPTIEPLPDVNGCGMPGCMSSIKKHLLPAGWLLRDGRWLCPRCKVIATSEAS